MAKKFLYRRGCIVRVATEDEIHQNAEKHPLGSKEREGAERILALKPGNRIVFPNSGVTWFAFDESIADKPPTTDEVALAQYVLYRRNRK